MNTTVMSDMKQNKNACACVFVLFIYATVLITKRSRILPLWICVMILYEHVFRIFAVIKTQSKNRVKETT